MSLETTTESETVFTLRVPQTLNEKLIGEAKAENRSRQSLIVYLLNKHFETPAGNGSKRRGKLTGKF